MNMITGALISRVRMIVGYCTKVIHIILNPRTHFFFFINALSYINVFNQNSSFQNNLCLSSFKISNFLCFLCANFACLLLLFLKSQLRMAGTDLEGCLKASP